MLSLLKRHGFTIGYVWSVIGAALLLAGVTIDLARHASEAEHASERIFDLGNPGHVIAIAGIYNLAAGLICAGLCRWVLGRASFRRTLGAGVLSLAVAAGFSAAVVHFDARIGAHESEAHLDAAEDSHAGHLRLLSENALFAEIEEKTFHEPRVTAPVTRANLAYAEDFIAKARSGTEKYKDIVVARRDGYIQITPYIPIIGAHFANPNSDARLDPARPPVLLYRPSAGGGWQLVGVAYVQPKTVGVETPPATQFGGLVQWHYHSNLCFDFPTLKIVAAASDDDCESIFVEETPWLLHAWLWLDSPEGMFDHANSLLQ